MTKPLNPPAFPNYEQYNEIIPCPHCAKAIHVNPMHKGMTIRDYFAGKCLTGFLSCQHDRFDGVNGDKVSDVIAKNCYLMADAI